MFAFHDVPSRRGASCLGLFVLRLMYAFRWTFQKREKNSNIHEKKSKRFYKKVPILFL
eukprot:UN28062